MRLFHYFIIIIVSLVFFFRTHLRTRHWFIRATSILFRYLLVHFPTRDETRPYTRDQLLLLVLLVGKNKENAPDGWTKGRIHITPFKDSVPIHGAKVSMQQPSRKRIGYLTMHHCCRSSFIFSHMRPFDLARFIHR